MHDVLKQINYYHLITFSQHSIAHVNVNVNDEYAPKQKFSEEGVGPCEEMGRQPISELFTTDDCFNMQISFCAELSALLSCR